MKIKTILFRIDNAADFDNAVNAALEDGWKLVKRDVVRPYQPHTDTRFFHAMLYAELVKTPEVGA
jgi:hypothetical protein